MAVASKIAPCLLVAVSLVGCAGNVIEGLPRDGSVLPEGDEPVGSAGDSGTRDAMVVPRDATVADPGSRDAGNSTPREDAGAPQTDSGAPPANNNDAGSVPGTALNGGALARPNNGRQFTANLADWMGNPRCMEGTGAGQVTFCDDFESTAQGGPPGTAWAIQGSSVIVSGDVPFRGTKSMRFGPPSGMPGQMEQVKSFPALQNKLFGRVFLYFFTDQPTAPADAKFTLIQVGGSDNAGQIRISGQVDAARGNKAYFGIGSDGGETGDWHTKGLEAQSEIKKRTWTCLEWMFDGEANETRVWIDNVEQLSLHTTAANYLVGDAEGGKQFIHPTYSYLKVGYWVYQSNATPNPAVVFFDELVLDDEQIGCSL
jgi:hypothetical protein